MLYITTQDKHGQNTFDLGSYDYKANRRIFLTGEITDETTERLIREMDYLSSVSSEDITLLINSPGGSVSSGLAIIDAMKRLPCDFRTVCTGITASMAAVIATCGGSKGKRYITPSAEMMIHQPLGGIHGQASDIEVAANRIILIKRKLNKMIAEATGQTLERVTADSDRDRYFDAAEAVEYGLVDGILE